MNDAALLQFPAADVKTTPLGLRRDEHPAYRLEHHGAATLSDAEILTLVMRTRVSSVDDLEPARGLVFDGLTVLARRAMRGTRQLRRRDAIRIAAAIELGRRVLTLEPQNRELFDTEQLARSLTARYAHHVQEHVGVVLLDSRDRVISEREVFVGTLQSAMVSPRDVLRLALEYHAAGIVIYHNHPSADPSPSAEAHTFTNRLRVAASLLDLALVDHLVVGGARYVSFRQRGYL